MKIKTPDQVILSVENAASDIRDALAFASRSGTHYFVILELSKLLSQLEDFPNIDLKINTMELGMKAFVDRMNNMPEDS